MKYDNYYLDLYSVNRIKSKDEREKVHTYYMNMMHSFCDGRTEMAKSLFYTLSQSGFLKDIRCEKIDKIIN